ncbi:MAG: hypothetical protein D3919_08300 [Candidatus Electrothrix sp. AW5]|nr:hypothetical protein [Candidatus Electrothrix gigas]
MFMRYLFRRDGRDVFMKYLSLAMYTLCIIAISGCHHEPPIPQPASSPVSSPSDDGTKREKYAVVIGINNYSKIPSLENLTHAVNDASAIATRLENMGFEVVRLLDEKATKENINAQFKRYKHVNRNSQLVIFYSGHGVSDASKQKGYIVSSDGERNSFEELRDNTFNLPPKHILYILDSCHSGFFDPAVQMKWPVSKDKEPIVSQQQERESKPAVYTLTAGSSKEKTMESDAKWFGHSYFTVYLLKGLDGVADINNDCKITVSELGVYLTQAISSQVVAENVKSQQKQNPLFNRVYGEGEITFIPPRCQENQKPDLQQQPVPKEKCDTQLFPDKNWEKSDAYKGQTAYKEPSQLLVDKDNNLYVLDAKAGMVYKFDANGKYIRSYYNENWIPTSMALNNDSSLWVYYSSDKRGEVVIYEGKKKPRRWEVNRKGKKMDGLYECMLYSEYDIPQNGLITIDAESNIILVDQETQILTKCTIEGKRFDQWGKHEDYNYFETVTKPQGLAVDQFGYIYVADTGGHGIQRYSFDGTWLSGWVNAEGDSPHFFDSPHGITVDKNFHVYIADTDNDRIKKYTIDGKHLLACWGKQRDIDFDDPQGVAVSLDGRFMYVADTGNERIQRFVLSQNKLPL